VREQAAMLASNWLPRQGILEEVYIYLPAYRACKYSVVAWFSRARAANSLYKKLIIKKPIKP